MGQHWTQHLRVTELQSQLETNEQRLRKMREQLTRLQLANLQGELREKDTEITSLQKQLRMEQHRNSLCDRQWSTNGEEISWMKEQWNDLDGQMQEEDKNKETLQGAEVQRKLILTNDPKMTTIKERTTDPLGKGRQTKGKETTAIREQLNDFQGQSQRLREKEARVSELESKLATKEEEIQLLREQLNEFQVLQELSGEKEQRIAELRRDLISRQKEIETLTEELSNLQGQEERYTEQRRLITELQHLLDTNEEEIRWMRQELRETQQRETELNRTLSECHRGNPRDWVINRNEIQLTSQQLGQGAWGRVFRGRFRECDVAVNEMYENIMSDHNRLLFEREVDIASKCRHPCLLQFIGATADDERPLLVTEIMDYNLRAKLHNRGESPLTAKEGSVISLDVARALNYLHQKPTPIIHRDISSANVLLWRHGDQWRAKVSDYGTANFVCQSTRNDTGAAIYSAPESLNGNPDQPISCKEIQMTSLRCNGQYKE